MGKVFNVGRVCRFVTFGVVLSASVSARHACALPASGQPAQAAKARATDMSPSSATVANPLRAASAPAQVTTPPPSQAVPPLGPLVPNTGRLRLFAAGIKAGVGTAEQSPPKPSSARGGLFPPGQLLTALAQPRLRVMRYADVAEGAAVVPVTPPQRVKPGQAATSPATKQIADRAPAKPAPPLEQPLGVKKKEEGSDVPPAPHLKIERLPPVTRMAPRPTLPPGVKLPQQPIEIYPETGL